MEPNGGYFVYFIECKDGSVYVGKTRDLRTRIEQHELGVGAKWTKNNGFKRIAHYEWFESEYGADRREKECFREGQEYLKKIVERADEIRKMWTNDNNKELEDLREKIKIVLKILN